MKILDGIGAGVFVTACIVIALMAVIGWIRCLTHFVRADFEAPYKAEIVYGVGTFTGAGAIIGWININD